MTRFHITLIVALVLGAVMLAFGQSGTFAGVVGGFLVVAGLGVAFPQMRFFGPFICRGPSARRCVALTFDDGPDASSTPALLDFLREEKLAVAFFGIGKRVAANPDLAARIVREGHLLENHSYTHSNFTNFFSLTRLRAELTQTQAAIAQATGIAPRCFRPPMGLSNPRIFRAAREVRLSVVGWNTRGLDTQITDPQRIVARIMQRLAPGGIILLHDGNIPAARLLLTVKLLLAGLRERGYEIVRLDKLIE
jgi:peptidoglycan/xylan/chitin deacetylase (PgdA/CDA1 family)